MRVVSTEVAVRWLLITAEVYKMIQSMFSTTWITK